MMYQYGRPSRTPMLAPRRGRGPIGDAIAGTYDPALPGRGFTPTVKTPTMVGQVVDRIGAPASGAPRGGGGMVTPTPAPAPAPQGTGVTPAPTPAPVPKPQTFTPTAAPQFQPFQPQRAAASPNAQLQNAWSNWLANETNKAFGAVRQDFSDRNMLYSSAIADPLADVATQSSKIAADLASQEQSRLEQQRQFDEGLQYQAWRDNAELALDTWAQQNGWAERKAVFDENVRQFGLQYALAQDEAANGRDQFSQTMALERSKLAQQESQFGRSFNEQQRQSNIGNALNAWEMLFSGGLGLGALDPRKVQSGGLNLPSNNNLLSLIRGMNAPVGDPPENEGFAWDFLAPKKSSGGPVGDGKNTTAFFSDAKNLGSGMTKYNLKPYVLERDAIEDDLSRQQLAISRMNAQTSRDSLNGGSEEIDPWSAISLYVQEQTQLDKDEALPGIQRAILPSQILARIKTDPLMGQMDLLSMAKSGDEKAVEIIKTLYPQSWRERLGLDAGGVQFGVAGNDVWRNPDGTPAAKQNWLPERSMNWLDRFINGLGQPLFGGRESTERRLRRPSV